VNRLRALRLEGLTAAGRAKKELAESEEAGETVLRWGCGSSFLFSPLSSRPPFIPSSIRELVKLRTD